MHNTLKLEQPKGIQPSLTVLFTPVLLLLWRENVLHEKGLLRICFCYCVCATTLSLFVKLDKWIKCDISSLYWILCVASETQIELCLHFVNHGTLRKWTTVKPLSASWKVDYWRVQWSVYSAFKKLDHAELLLLLKCEHNFRNQPWRSPAWPPPPHLCLHPCLPCCHVRCHAKKLLHSELNMISSNHNGCVTCQECDVTCWKQLSDVCVCVHVDMPSDTPTGTKEKSHYSNPFLNNWFSQYQRLHAITFWKDIWCETACREWLQFSLALIVL